MASRKKNPFPTLILGAIAPPPSTGIVQNAPQTASVAVNVDGIEAPQYFINDGRPDVVKGKHTRLVTANYEYDSLNGNAPSQEHREYLQLFKMAACILPVCPSEGKYMLIRQFRYPAWYNANKAGSPTINDDGWLYEAIAGVIEPGDNSAQTVIREAEEEGGITLEVDDIREVHKCFMTPGITNEEISIYIGLVDQTSAVGQTGLIDQGEHLRAKWMTADEIRRLAALGQIKDAKTLIALYSARVL